MANRIAEAFIEIKTRGAEKVRAAIKGANKNLGDTQKSADRASAKVEGIGKAAEGVQSTLGKLLMPVAFITAVAGVVQQFLQIGQRADDARNEIRKATQEVNKFAASAAQASRGFTFATPESIDNLRAAEQAVEGLREKLFQLQRDQQQNLLNTVISEGLNLVADSAVDTTNEIIADLEQQIRDAEAKAEQARRDLQAASNRDRKEAVDLAAAENEVLRGKSARLVEILRLEQQIGKAQRDNNQALKDALVERLDIIKGLYEEERRLAAQAQRDILREFERTQRETVSSLFDSQSQSFKRIEDLLNRQINKLEQIRKLPR